MKEMRVGLHATAVSTLEFVQLLRLRIVCFDWKSLVDEKVPHLLPTVSGIESFELGVTDPPVMVIGNRWFGPVTLADQLDDTFALINLLAQHRTQVASLRSKDVLPNRFVAQKSQCIGDELPRAAQFFTDGGDKDWRAWRHHSGASSAPVAHKDKWCPIEWT